MLREISRIHARHYTARFTHADERSLGKGSHRFHALCAKVNRRGKRRLPVILTRTKVQPPTTKTMKKLENPRSAAARLGGARSQRKRSNGTGGSYRRSFTRTHNYPVSWRTSSTGVSIRCPLMVLPPSRRIPSAFLWLMKAHLSREYGACNVSLVSFTQDKCSPCRRKGRTAMICRSHYAEKRDDLSEKRLLNSLFGVCYVVGFAGFLQKRSCFF